MEYVAVKFSFSFREEFASDLFVALLADNGFESFECIDAGVVGYIPSPLFDEAHLYSLVSDFEYDGVEIREIVHIADQDWNEEWEKNFFKPIVIGDECVIHSSFHTDLPQLKYDILIDPKMAFGTGHHATTSLMVGELLHADLKGKSLLDMGCGTAVLAILAAKRGAGPITAIDIDTWCVENAEENIALNGLSGIEVQLGDARLLSGRHFDVVLANINRNVLMADMHVYADCLPVGGDLYLSGFYIEDTPLLEHEAGKYGLILENCKERDNWAMLHFIKK